MKLGISYVQNKQTSHQVLIWVWVKIQNDLPKQIYDLQLIYYEKLPILRVHWYLMFDPYPFVFEHKKDDTHEITEPQEAA